jgi:mannitol-specific phosphotransferase system IIBC component
MEEILPSRVNIFLASLKSLDEQKYTNIVLALVMVGFYIIGRSDKLHGLNFAAVEEKLRHTALFVCVHVSVCPWEMLFLEANINSSIISSQLLTEAI